jgi:hypothetical protein
VTGITENRFPRPLSVALLPGMLHPLTGSAGLRLAVPGRARMLAGKIKMTGGLPLIRSQRARPNTFAAYHPVAAKQGTDATSSYPAQAASEAVLRCQQHWFR